MEWRSAISFLTFLSQPRSIMLCNRKYQWSGSDVDRDHAREYIVEGTPSGAWRSALGSKVVAVGEGPAGGARLRRFSRSPAGTGR